ncbi:hypothetical protein K439DRAFT_1614459 [Ramaria rubella]|nr:hypothetical protein K439DRAFT_1614459 [Ramaria rubella]
MPPNPPLLAAAPSSPPASTANTTSVIIGVTVPIGVVILLVVVYRVWRYTRPSGPPLPPKGPLAYDRQRQIAAAYSNPDLRASFKISRSPFMNSHATPYGHDSPNTSLQADEQSIPPSPSVVSSQAHLVSTPTENEANAEVPRGRRASMSSSASAIRHNGHRPSTRSTSGSVRSTRSRQSSYGPSRSGTIRGAPHHNRVDIVLPQPLAPGLYAINNSGGSRTSRSTPRSRVPSRERRPEFHDKEHPSGRVSMDGPPPLSHEPDAHANFQHTSPEYPPPVPPLPVEYAVLPSSTSVPPSPDVSKLSSPNASRPLLSGFSPSPERGPAPLPPPKDVKPRRPSRPYPRGESTERRQPP